MISSKIIIKSIPFALKTLTLKGFEKKIQGKVKDNYLWNDKRIIIYTDRQSAFDVILGLIPFKGAVLNLLSAFWFKKTQHIINNHLIKIVDPNVAITYNCQSIPIEMVVRGYLTGVTKTSPWYLYQKGYRIIYGLKFPNGLKKNEKLPSPIITPTTHPPAGTKKHDEKLTREEILKRKIVSKKLYQQMETISLKLYQFGYQLCQEKGLILVDTKYEFGLHNNQLVLIDEIHTPDSSRFWIKKTYQMRFNRGLEPENFDKEFLRLWYVNHGFAGDGKPPPMPEELIVAMAKRYIKLYEIITGEKFSSFHYPIEKRILKNLVKIF